MIRVDSNHCRTPLPLRALHAELHGDRCGEGGGEGGYERGGGAKGGGAGGERSDAGGGSGANGTGTVRPPAAAAVSTRASTRSAEAHCGKGTLVTVGPPALISFRPARVSRARDLSSSTSGADGDADGWGSSRAAPGVRVEITISHG
jgi:hypothetical protein